MIVSAAPFLKVDLLCPLLTICFVCLTGAASVALIVLSRHVRLPLDAPLAGLCSVSIAAACQPEQGKKFKLDLAHRYLQWGVVSNAGERGSAGYATFTDGEVKPLLPDESYA